MRRGWSGGAPADWTRVRLVLIALKKLKFDVGNFVCLHFLLVLCRWGEILLGDRLNLVRGFVQVSRRQTLSEHAKAVFVYAVVVCMSAYTLPKE